MNVQIEATPAQIKSLIEILKQNPHLEAIQQQLTSAQVDADDSQEGEVPEEGDNEIIERSE